MAAITVTTLYDEQPRRNVTAIQYECQGCGQVWEHPNLAAALKATTSSPFDRQCEKHWRTCTQETT